MKSLFRFSKALTMGTLATLLLVAATGNQAALGAANVAATTQGQRTVLPPGQQQEQYIQITGQYPGPILMIGFTVGCLASAEQAPAHHTTDFSAFD